MLFAWHIESRAPSAAMAAAGLPGQAGSQDLALHSDIRMDYTCCIDTLLLLISLRETLASKAMYQLKHVHITVTNWHTAIFR